MNVRMTRLALALATFPMLFTATASANNELRFSELEQRLATLEEHLASQQRVQAAAYLSGDSVECHGNSKRQRQGCYDCYGDCHYGQYYAQVELYWARLHLAEAAAGKLSENHDVSPRIVLGFENACGIGGRIRYWHYGEETDLLDSPDEIGFDLDVLDLEGTNHFHVKRTDITLGGGLRLADIDSTDDDRDNIHNSMLGLTMAADLRTRLCCYCGNRFAAVYGGRLSLLGGDWEGAGHDFIRETRDDNLVVHELYSGLEHSYRYFGQDWYTRVVVEMQTWESDAMQEVDKFSFVGPSWHLGARF